jgi:hypothetical protein
MARHTEVVDSQFQRLFSSVVDMRTDISAMSKSMQTSSSQLPRSLGFPWEASSSLAENVLLFDANGRSLLLPMLFLSTPHVSPFNICESALFFFNFSPCTAIPRTVGTHLPWNAWAQEDSSKRIYHHK